VPERILARLILRDQTTLYLIKWKDRYQRDATWEVAEDVESCDELLSRFAATSASVKLPCEGIRVIFSTSLSPLL
jgi:hypothetical protein